ncbi:MAG TPA: hypothetical protein VJM34_17815 [Novosphingobium sp.]|nr:hypothetical protein [Novosphingobium sp.]
MANATADKALTGSSGLWLGLVLSALASLPSLVARFPQMTDYPAHLASYRVMLERGRDPFLARYYGYDWHWTGNLGADLLAWPLGSLFGVEIAGRIIVTLIPLLTGLGLVCVSWTLYRRVGMGAVLAFAFIWSPSLLLGFLNFTLSLALALFAFAAWMRLEDRSWRWAVFVPVGLAVWLCHASGWGVLGVMVFGYEWSRRKGLAAFVAPWPLVFPLFAMLAGEGTNALISYGRFIVTYKTAIWFKAMRDQVYALDVIGLLVVLIVIVLALRHRRIDARLGWAALLMALLSLAVPRHVFGGDYADYRLVSVALMLACLAIDWRTPAWTVWLAAGLFLARLGVTTATWHERSQATEAMVAELDTLPRGAHVAMAIPVDLGDWRITSFEHLASYAVVRKSALANTNFALRDIHMLRVEEGSFGPGRPFADPCQRILYWGRPHIDLAAFEPATHADYLWYVGKVTPVTMPPGSRIIHRTPHSFLARLAKPDTGG